MSRLWIRLKERWRMLWAVVLRPTALIALAVWLFFWSACQVYDLVLSQWIPPETAKDFPKVWEIGVVIARWAAAMTTWMWIALGLLILFAATLEFAVRQNRKLARQGADSATGKLVQVATPYSQWKDLDQIDLATAAAIWSGTRDENDVNRHLRFRELKQAVREGRLKPHYVEGGKVNIRTTVKPADLHTFFRASGTQEQDAPQYPPSDSV